MCVLWIVVLVLSSATGAICLDILKKDAWAAAMTLRTVLLSLQVFSPCLGHYRYPDNTNGCGPSKIIFDVGIYYYYWVCRILVCVCVCVCVSVVIADCGPRRSPGCGGGRPVLERSSGMPCLHDFPPRFLITIMSNMPAHFVSHYGLKMIATDVDASITPKQICCEYYI